uniref:Uncharacterized protein n=1 Tax=Aegilops tauschii subsp. strangulata TaxID=200361 RepID=A0A453HDC2_AEGTS
VLPMFSFMIFMSNLLACNLILQVLKGRVAALRKDTTVLLGASLWKLFWVKFLFLDSAKLQETPHSRC